MNCAYPGFVPNSVLKTTSVLDSTGDILTLGFPPMDMMSTDDRVIIGIDNNSTDDITVKIKNYQLDARKIALNTVQKGIVLEPLKYR